MTKEIIKNKVQSADEISEGTIETITYRKKQIRKQFYNGEWWFVVVDIISIVSTSKKPKEHFKSLRRRNEALGEIFHNGQKAKGELTRISPSERLTFVTKGGRQPITSWDYAGIDRMLSIMRSKKAAPFRRWFAKNEG
jgi:prophage antirepressor-like protein